MSATGAVLSEETKDRIREVLRRHGVIRASLFGSFARGDATAESDVDLLVELPTGKSLFDLIGLEQDLCETLGVKVDVLTYASLRPRMRQRVLADEVPIL